MQSNTIRRGKFAAVLGAASFLAAALPMAAQAQMVTFDWVPISEKPASGLPASGPSTAHGSITLDIQEWALATISGNGLGPNFYTSGTPFTATITSLSYTFGNGVTVDKSNLSTTLIGKPNSGSPPTATIWSTSAMDTPANGPQAPSPPTPGYYLTTQFSVSGTEAGMGFMLGSNAGTAGANFQNGIGNGGNNQGTVPAGISDGGYWKLEPVPLPAALPLLLSGLGLMGWSRRRRN